MSKCEYLLNSFNQRDPELLPSDVLTGDYAFLLGAGASEPAGIPTNSELIGRWQSETYKKYQTNKSQSQWVKYKESKEKEENQSRYGFWFEKRYDKKDGRRKEIKDIVEGTQPTAGHVILASMMINDSSNKGIPITFTSNFDNLIEDAFYYYFEEFPHVIDHPGVADTFRLRQNEPAVVKLHGDYRINNLQNTDDEREKLEENFESLVRDTTKECGLVIIGYSGRDDSIMSVLLERVDKFGDDFKIYWCILNEIAEEKKYLDNILSKSACELLNKSNSSIVRIDGFVPLMFRFARDYDKINIPGRDKLVKRAENRTESLYNNISNTIASQILNPNKNVDESMGNLISQLGLEPTEQEVARIRKETIKEIQKSIKEKFVDVFPDLLRIYSGEKDVKMGQDNKISKHIANKIVNEEITEEEDIDFETLVYPLDPEEFRSYELFSEEINDEKEFKALLEEFDEEFKDAFTYDVEELLDEIIEDLLED